MQLPLLALAAARAPNPPKKSLSLQMCSSDYGFTINYQNAAIEISPLFMAPVPNSTRASKKGSPYPTLSLRERRTATAAGEGNLGHYPFSHSALPSRVAQPGSVPRNFANRTAAL